MPDAPPDLVACLLREENKGENANDQVIALIDLNKKRRQCAIAFIAWYKTIQDANGGKKKIK